MTERRRGGRGQWGTVCSKLSLTSIAGTAGALLSDPELGQLSRYSWRRLSAILGECRDAREGPSSQGLCHENGRNRPKRPSRVCMGHFARLLASLIAPRFTQHQLLQDAQPPRCCHACHSRHEDVLRAYGHISVQGAQGLHCWWGFMMPGGAGCSDTSP